MDCGWNLFTKEGVLHLRLDLCPLSFCSRLVFFLQNTYDRKRKYFVLRAPAQRWSLKLYFFQNNHMKTFSVAFTRLKCSEILSIAYKKNGEPFFESLTFASAMIYQNEVRTKHLRMLIFYSAMDDPSLLRRTIILFR